MQKKLKLLTGPIVLAAYIATILACATPKQTQTKEAPGFYNLTGWNGQTKWKNGDHYEATGIDIEGKVAYPLSVSGPTARCIPKTSVGWSGYSRIISGQFPPGIGFENGDAIKGIPTKRGNWIVTVELYNISCNGQNYISFQQQLRFHIGGVGIVNN